MAEEEAAAQAQVVHEESQMVAKMANGPMKALKMKALAVARKQAEDKAREAASFQEYDEKRREATGGAPGAPALPEKKRRLDRGTRRKLAVLVRELLPRAW